MRLIGVKSGWVLVFMCLIKMVYTHTKQMERLQLEHIKQSSTFDMVQDFRKPKKVVFSSLTGGSSHNHWVISILNELNLRGHSTDYITMGDHVKFSRNYPEIKTFSIGETLIEDHDLLVSQMQDGSLLNSKIELVKGLSKSFRKEYLQIYEIMNTNNYDVAICDQLNSPCQEVALKLGIPSIITSSMPHSSDASAPYINNDFISANVPTTQFMSLWERFLINYISPLEYSWKMASFHFSQKRMYESLGLELRSQDARWKDSLKMYNTAFGFQLGRALGPLVEFIGPIVKTQIPKLTSKLQNYLDTHKKVVYVGFGQHAVINKNDVSLILNALLEAYEEEDIDGVIWASRHEDTFPSYLLTQSGKNYTVSSFFDLNNQSDIMILEWAPQMAIMNHPSVSMVLHHGGSASLYESLYSGARMVIFPFFADQPTAAIIAERMGYSLTLHRTATQEEANRIIRTVARDADNKFQRNADRFKALVQIRSKNGVIRGADLVEETLFLSEDNKMSHRRDVKYDMSYIKANNLDLNALLAIIAMCVCCMLWRFVKYTMKEQKQHLQKSVKNQ